MKKLTTCFLLLGIILLTNIREVVGQNINVTGAIVGNGTYPDLGTAFTAINGGAQTGASIIVSVVGNTTEPVTATLNQGAWTTLSILPAGGAARSISGNIIGPLVDFNGADRVVVNGLNTGGNSLTFDNTNNTTASTLRFINDSRSVFVQNATILGAGASTTSGTVFISTSAGGAGNDSIAFSTCTIDASGANFPTNAVYSLGTTTAGQENSNIGFNTCNIANFFSATLISRGIFADVGNTDWIVQGCRFYQAATRTYTTANTHRAIQIASGNNHAITGNTIGFATAAGTGTYTMAGTIATRLIGIDLGVGATTASSVQGNTISSISLNTSSGATTANGILCGISITGSGNVNVGNLAPNIIGATTGVSSLVAVSTTAGGVTVGIHSSSTGTVVIQNNQMGAITCSGVTGAISGSVLGINVSGAAASMTITGNTIGNTTTDNIRGGTLGLTTGASSVAGISLTATPTVAVVSNNTIQNLASYGTATGAGAFVRGIFTATATTVTATFTITGNTITNLTTNSGLTGIGSGLSGALGIHHLSAVGTNISGNTISNISNINTGTGAYHVLGISVAGSAVTTTLGTNVFNNRIFNLSNASTATSTTAPGVVAGISIRSGNAATTVYNNMISLGTTQTTNTAFIGIYGNHGSTPDPTADRIYHNTINITGTVTAGAQPSFGIYRGDFSLTTRTVPMDIRNNIITNTRTGGTGPHFAIANNFGATVSATGWGANASNNNVLNANAATIGWWGANQTFAGWQTASASDGSSLSGVTVTYVNPANDLHLNMGVTPTPIESGGQTIALVPTDFDAQTRPGPAGSVNGGAFAPDLGADEFDGVFQDVIAPVITYTPLTFTCSTGDRVFTATIADFTGVPTSGVLQPRVYFRKNALLWNTTAGVLSAGTGTNGTWTFTITAASMGGLIVGDVVSYYVIAQDVAGAPNITSNPAVGLVATNVNTVTTPPTTPNAYPISNVLSGTYTVGASGTYPTLTAAVNAYNNSCLGGPVIFSLMDATYPAETFPLTLLSNANASSTNTLTIKPATGVISTVSGSSATYLLGINGGDFITVNGSNGNMVNSLCPETTASRDLTFTNTNVATTSAVISLQTTAGGNASTNNRVINCNVIGNSNTTTLVGINMSGTAIGSATGANGNNKNSLINNSIQKVQYGIFSAGGSAVAKNVGNVYDLNDLNGAGANAVGLNGITVIFEDSAMIRSNNIGNISFAGNADVIGISIGSTNAANTLTTGVEVTNSIISNNTITSLVQTNTYSAVGINIASTSTGTNQVTNNMISGVFSNGTSPDFACGIFCGGGSTQIYYNTVQVNGAALTGADQPNMALGINGTTPNMDIKNNILICTGTNGYNGNTGIGLGYTSATGNYLNLLSNFNDIFVSGTTSSIGRTGSLGPVGVQRITLADWQTETGRDLNSVNINPTFVSATDVHLVAGSNPGIENAGTPVIILSDIDCQGRTATPDMGADEICTAPTTPTAALSVNPTCAGATTVLSIASGSLNDAASWQWYSGSCGGTPVGSGATLNVSPLTTTNYFVRAEGGCALSPGSCGNITLTVNPLPTVNYSITPNDTVCAGTTLTLSGTGADTYTWTGGVTNAVGFISAASGTYTVTGTITATGCTNTAVAPVVVNPQPLVNYTVSPNDTVCAGSNITLSGTGANSYTWSGGVSNGIAFVPPITGTYTVTGTVTATGCSNTAAAPIVVGLIPTVGYTISPNDSICLGDLLTLSGTGANAYTWTGGVINATPFAPGVSGNYTVTGTSTLGCTNTASAAIVVSPVPTVSYTVAANDTVCAGSSVTLSGTGANSYTWTGGLTDAVSFVPASSGTYTVTGTNTTSGCTNTASADIVVNPLPTVSYTVAPNDTVCPGGSVTLSGTGAASYTWTGGITDAVSFTPAASLTYTVTGTDGNGCSNTATAPIVVGTVPVVNLGPDVIQPNPPAVLDAGVGFSSYLWNTTANTQTISVNVNGQYIVTVTNVFGCTDSDTINVNFTSGVVNVNGTATLFGLYPNPTTNGVFNVSIQNIETSNLVMEVLDINGRVVHNRTIGSVSGNIIEPFSLTDLSMGTYIMRITANGTSTQLRFIINQ